MDNNTKQYVDNNIKMLKDMMNVFHTLLVEIKNKEELSKINKNIVFNKEEFKLAMLSFLLSGNFDNIIDDANADLKKSLINNDVKKRVKSKILFENGQDFEIGKGLRIINISPKIQNDYDKIVKVIRNSIAHSRYTLINDDIYIKNYNFEALVSIGWLEQFTLGMFSNNAHQSSKSGVDDNIYMNLYNNDDKIINNDNDLKQFLKSSYKLNVTLTKNAEKEQFTYSNLKDIISSIFEDKATFIKCKHIKNEKERIKEALRRMTLILETIKNQSNHVFNYKLNKLDNEIINELDSLKSLLYGNAITPMIVSVIASKIESYRNDEKRNVIAYKRILELIELIEKDRDITKYETIYYLDICYQFCFKAYMNLIFNYVKEHSKHNVIDTKDIKVSLLNFEKIKLKKIKEIIKKSNNTNKINKINQEILDYKNNAIDLNKLYISHIRNSLAHNNIEFKDKMKIDECIFTDYELDILNFKAKGKIEDFISIADDYYYNATNSKKLTK